MPDQQRNLARNVRALREAQGHSQQQMAELSGLPRPTWASLETGAANPTLNVLTRAAAALGVSIEELIAEPREEIQLVRAAEIRPRRRRGAEIRPLIPVAIPGLELSRLELAPRARLVGIPHTRGTREFLTLERGVIEVIAAGRHWRLDPGDMLIFRGDQPHSYVNPQPNDSAVGVAAVCFSRR